MPSESSIGIVIIGRNEGERFRNCVQSLVSARAPVIYVDSGSIDGSQAYAQANGCHLVALDLSRPFTAARARNEGAKALLDLASGCRFIQFIDGDCTLEPAWLAQAAHFLEGNPAVAAVAGRLTEMHPEHSIYNWMCDVEWNQPAGETNAIGGIAMYRADAFNGAGGFNPAIIAGEEPEFCIRLREQGWKIWRLADPMARHDAAMTRFPQWWRRAIRSGYGMARVALLHRNSPKAIWKREVLRALAYAAFLPMTILAAAVLHPAALAGLLIYPLQIARMAGRLGASRMRSWHYASLMMLSKLAEAYGTLGLGWDMVLGRSRGIFDKKQ